MKIRDIIVENDESDDDLFGTVSLINKIESLIQHKQKVFTRVPGAMGQVMSVSDGNLILRTRPRSTTRYSWGGVVSRPDDFKLEKGPDGMWYLRDKEDSFADLNENDEEDLFGHSDRVGNDLRRVTYRERMPSMIKMIHGGLEANAGSLVKQMAAELGRDADVFRRDPVVFDYANELISEIAAQVSDILMNLDPVMINDEDALNNALTDYAADIRSSCNLWYYIEEVLGETGDEDGAYACAMTIEGEIGALLIKLIQHAYSQLSLSENFHDGRHPEDKGDSKRLGVPTKASISTLRKVAKQGGRKGQLAHWMANMKSGRAKAKK